jgi:serine/threonine-protein kinase
VSYSRGVFSGTSLSAAIVNVCPLCGIEYPAEMESCPRDGARLGLSAASTDPFIGKVLADRYRVLRTIGEGGMGRVYLAEHVRMGRLSAVKVMSPALAPTPEAISRFNREASNASRINHPNVAAIYDFGETEDGTLYLAMEYVEGKTLTGILRDGGPLLPARAAELTAQIADGLHAAHHLGIVHRDLKPDNILVTIQHDGRELVKIVDFGIAKTTQSRDQTVTSLGVAIGTPEYMSPEQIAGEALDSRTDLYSLALVLFNMLTGALPHPALTSKQSLVQRLTSRPLTLAEVKPSVPWPPRVQKALDRALAPEPDDRYSNVLDFARDVRGATGLPTFQGAAIVAGAATRAMTPAVVPAVSATTSRPRPTMAPPKRRRGGLLLAALVLVGGVGAVAVHPPAQLRALVRGSNRGAPTPAPASAFDTAPGAHAAMPATAPGAVESSGMLVTLAGTAAVPHDSTVASDSTTAGAGDSLSPFDGGFRLRRAAMQAAQRASGDSAPVSAVPPTTNTAEADAREVMLHVNRAREFTRQMQLRGAGLELRTAFQEYKIFLTEHASAPQTEMLRSELQQALDGALATCQVARDSAIARGARPFRCRHPAQTGILQEDEDTTATPRFP